MNKKYFVADSMQISMRKNLAEEFYDAILDPEEKPFIVTDEASLYDISLEDEDEIIQKIKEKYGILIDVDHFKIPFWKLLDYLNKNRNK